MRKELLRSANESELLTSCNPYNKIILVFTQPLLLEQVMKQGQYI